MMIRIQGVNFWGSKPILQDTTTKAPIMNTNITQVTKSYYQFEVESDRFKRVQSRTEALNNQEAWYGVNQTNNKPKAELLLNPFYNTEDPFTKYNFGDNNVEMTGARYVHKRMERKQWFPHFTFTLGDFARLVIAGGLLWLVFKFVING